MAHFLSVEENGITITAKSSKTEDWKIYSNNWPEMVLVKKDVKRVYMIREVISETELRGTLLDESKR